MDLYEELENICEEHGTTLMEVFLNRYVLNYVECCSDFENKVISDEVISEVAQDIAEDDEVWNNIDDAIYYYVNKKTYNNDGGE